MKVSGLRLCFFTLHFWSTWLFVATATRPLLPTSTFAGLRAAQADLEMQPTPTPWSQAEVWKRLVRLSGDPDICGWVEGNQGELGETESQRVQVVDSKQTIPYLATLDILALQPRPTSAVAPRVPLVARRCSQCAMAEEDLRAKVHVS